MLKYNYNEKGQTKGKTRSMNRPYSLADKYTEQPDNSHKHFQLHTHEFYELYLFLKGDTKLIVEGVSYDLNPYDIVIIGKSEFHQVFHNSTSPYHRITLMLSTEFFTMNNCQVYEEHFAHISAASGHKIPGNIVRSSGLYDAFMRYKKYSNNYQNRYDFPVTNAIIIEILHIISRLSFHKANEYLHSTLQPLINYLNQHFTEEITLDMLQDKFFISKYHLCRTFKKYTGLTLHDYLQKKRLVHARELKAQGMSLTDVATMSGFRDYSSFYRAYQKEYNTSPKVDLK